MDSLIDALPQLLDGLKNTILLTIFSLILGSTLGIALAIGRSYGGRLLAFGVYLYEKVLRGIPLLVLFFLIYFGLTEVGIDLDPFPAAILGLGLRSAAYQAQIYRGAINSIPTGQTLAAYSLGMSRLKTIRYIILPQVIRLSIPGWSNELTIVLKDTSIAFSIGVIELMRQGRYIYALDYNLVLPVLLLIALIYFVIVFSINKGLGYLEKKYKLLGLQT
ncbi:MAG: amino acid ABC transporter permease [Candidatus Thermoplasmatota archaeon]|nr:amino acid ABC transporter permease [Candidatus Thermoplasmatota archaeon]MBU1941362.1 amino acid ABC transporter permease [Candidatus Thermoplasmatota archaeon]